MTEESWDDYLAAHDDVDAAALAETELSDASTDVIHASTTDDVDTMHDWTHDGSEEY